MNINLEQTFIIVGIIASGLAGTIVIGACCLVFINNIKKYCHKKNNEYIEDNNIVENSIIHL
jgi:hypothetical protein